MAGFVAYFFTQIIMKRQLKLYVIIGFILAAALLSSISAYAAPHPRGDGRLILYSYHTDDVLEITFRTSAGYDEKAMGLINWVMRSRDDDTIHPVSRRLVDLLDNIQDHFGAETVEIISGYRSQPFNEFLRASGRGAAGESLHTKGMAADIHVDEITERALWDYVKSLGVGGAGYYPRHNFVHVDVGPRRTWREPDPQERILTGTELSPNKGWSVLTDKNIYRPGEPVELTITNEMPQGSSLTKNFWYERFRKGRWSEHKFIEKSRRAAKLSPGQSYKHVLKPKKLDYCKYRIVVFTSRDFKVPPAYSNEFYVKKPRPCFNIPCRSPVPRKCSRTSWGAMSRHR